MRIKFDAINVRIDATGWRGANLWLKGRVLHWPYQYVALKGYLMNKLLIAAALAATAVAAPAVAADPASAAPAASALSVESTDIGTLIDNPAAKAVIDKHMPGFTDNPQIEMARSMTLKQIQGFAPDQIKDEILIKIDADLKAVK